MGCEVDFDRCIGRVLARHRKDRGMSIKELAYHVDRSVTDVRKYEAGYNRLGASLFISVCSVLSLDIITVAKEARGLLLPRQ